MDSLLKQFAQSSQLGANADFIEGLYEQYLVSPDSVGPQWKTYFDGMHGREAGDVPHSAVIHGIAQAGRRAAAGVAAPEPGTGDDRDRAVGKLVTAYRSRGHLGANLDPLGMAIKPDAPDLTLGFHRLSDADLGGEFFTGGVAGRERMKLADLLALLKATYTGSIGAEFMHIADAEQRRWMYERLEAAAGDAGQSKEAKLRILERLTAADGLERYLHTKYVGQKRFSLEGGDSLIPLLDIMLRRAGVDGVKDVVIGMAHRGRLNVLVNTLGKPPRKLFDEFEGKFDQPPADRAHTGDVKYHMGFSADIATPGGPLHLALAFNPSHLEIVDPVVAGSVRSRQHRRGDTQRKQVLPVLLHGDAAFAGQGVVMELLQMSQARGFCVGGTVHLVINNQIGFTTSAAEDARSTLYCTDVAKMVGAPVLHVNGDDPEAVAFCAELAFDFRQRFSKDVVIDLVCYRRHGHNEADEPAATQPVMYKAIRAHKTTRELYADRLVAEGVLDAAAAKALVDGYRDKLDAGEVTTDVVDAGGDSLSIDWSKFLSGKLSDRVDTKVARKELDRLARTINTVPADISLHPRVAKIYADRGKMVAGELPADWGFAENLAYATLVAEGYKLRLVGQDSGRGTFFHRHAILHDQATDTSYIPLRELLNGKDKEDVTIIDSLLSEEAVMAFEYGYATADPMTLDIWEAQFGDFANGAQVVIDQFLSSGEAKWNRLCGLALFLPHGYEGQGPEHSSARLERFLQLCALDNMIVCAPTTPAQDFHMIRRQMRMATRKPLVVMTPKSLLRHKLAVSSLDELAKGSFQELIPDTTATAKKAKRVVVCAGKVYYDLVEAAQEQGIKDVAIVRVEQLYPFPREQLVAELKRHSPAKEVMWCQEEPQNQGAWYQIQHHLRACLLPGQVLDYAGRARSPSPAAGHMDEHVAEQAQLVADALVNPVDGDHVAERSTCPPRVSIPQLRRTPAMATEVKVPVLPESVSDATIANWNKKVGDSVARDENLVDLETDKVVLEVPSPVDGVIKEIRFESGATVTSQQVLAVIEEGAAAAPKAEAPKAEAPKAEAPKAATPPAKAAAPAPTKGADSNPSLPPGARFAAATSGVDAAQVPGTGRHGAVTKEDIVNYAAGRSSGAASGPRPEERVPMTRMRARIAERLMHAKDSIAMLTSFNEVNLAKVMAMRKELGEQFQKDNGVKLGFMSFFTKAAANALQKYPVVNASVDGNDVIYHGYADISIAVSTDRGLVTPVLRDVQRMSFADIELGIDGYAKASRDGSLKLEDLQGGTFTITNGGTFGSLMSTPIVNPPQSAILGMHTIKERAIVENGQVIAAPMMYIALSYDHRIVDGKDAVLFLVDIKNQLENPNRMLLGM